MVNHTSDSQLAVARRSSLNINLSHLLRSCHIYSI